MKKFMIDVAGKPLIIEVAGVTLTGGEEILLAHDDNLIHKTAWAKIGYTVTPFIDKKQCDRLVAGISDRIADYLQAAISIPLVNFELANYHEFIHKEAEHLAVVEKIRHGLPLTTLPIDVKLIEQRLSEICQIELTATNPYLSTGGNYSIRIIRPEATTDNNPPHRDVWLNHLRHCVNIYFPLAGSNELSALPLVPGSHLWKESCIERTLAGALINGVRYQVPAVVGTKQALRMIRPNPQTNEVMVFSPYLIHGGGINLNTDLTRVSLEMRFWRK